MMRFHWGLGEHWKNVLDALVQSISSYDKVSSALSFGKALSWRELGINGSLKEQDLVLDLGCGPGTMTTIAYNSFDKLQVVLLDALGEMLYEARSRLKEEDPDPVRALFETMPFKDECFDAVMCGFSIRDSINMHSTFREIIRILKKDGRLLIIDLGKPDNLLLRLLIRAYWRLLAPLIAIALIGRRGLLYLAIYKTYTLLPSNTEFRDFLKTLFRSVGFTTKMGGGAVIITASGKI